MPRENRVEKSRVHFSCQAQYLVKLECDFSWQAQHLVRLEADCACSAHCK